VRRAAALPRHEGERSLRATGVRMHGPISRQGR
jgi:hypothetical protein